ncbi:MAG: DUF2586 family protein, partial [Bacteroidales bacterium]|nr:DUF2586 family protein [Bacteroidales bacterium]
VKFGYAEDAESAGLTQSAQNWHVKVIAYHVAEFFRMNPKGTLYVGVYERPTGSVAKTYDELELLQAFARGELRQAGVWDGSTTIAATDVTALQSKASRLESEQTPMSLVLVGKTTKASALTLALRQAGRKNVSVCIAQDGDSTLFTTGNTGSEAVGCVGLVTGMMSLAAVNESVAWVERFPSGIDNPALVDGTLMSALTKTEKDTLDEKGLLFLLTYPAYAGSYLNDSHTLDVETSDYRYIERVRTMDKAVRGVYAALLPKLGGKVYVNPDDGTLRADTLADLENTANQPLREMEKAGELSGFVAMIDPQQPVLSTGLVEVVLKQVPTGVMRTIRVKIGFATSV